MNAFFAQAEQVDNVARHTPIRVSRDGTIGSSTLPLTVPGWEVPTWARESIACGSRSSAGR